MNDLDLMLHTLKALDYRTTDTVCCQCGKRIVIAGAVDPLERWLCPDCSEQDRPSYKPDTGFGT